jgi:uncharacterized protein (DUF983 family)
MTQETTLSAVEFVPGGYGPELRCPHCGYNSLHQGQVTVFDRNEDAKTTAVTTVADGVATTRLLPSDQTGNPSMRRHGLAIAFYCESCGNNFELTIAQHKGTTPVAWRFRP